MVQIIPQSSRNLRALFGPLFELAEQCPEVIGSMAGTFSYQQNRYGISRFVFVGPETEVRPIRLGLFAGIHGDEPAGCEALVRLLVDLTENPERATGYDLIVYPVCNPTGYEDRTRHNRAGSDLNREFWKSSTHPEVRILENELRTHKFDGLITLHSDDTSEGIYGYAHGRLLNEELLRPALRACEGILPRDPRANIDGFVATESMLCDCFPGVLSAPPEQEPKPFDLIFETPALAPYDHQVDATVVALKSVLSEYRRFIAFGQNL
ncbi:MAG TPA: succinylglutamate desuccinylase/aspartoacylase family protein [Opitutaceae bacterium]|nr:succinylglutamate desuccinylase/aspartoacylase family protein [Opitutaceae bacterium]